MSIRDKLYKLAVWYVGKSNSTDSTYLDAALKNLDRLTYKNGDTAYLNYGADAEWRKFGRYKVLNNAIQKLARYEDEEAAKENHIGEQPHEFNRNDIHDSKSFREAIIGITNYMAFYRINVVTLDDPIEVEWGLEGTNGYGGKKDVLPTIAIADKTEY